MKINWKKILNPNNIDFEKVKTMDVEEFDAYIKDVSRGEYAKVWIWFTYTVNCFCATGYWQYLVLMTIVKFGY